MGDEIAPPRVLGHGRMRALVDPEVDLLRTVGPDADPDRLLTSPRCHLLKFQRKIVVGRVETFAGPLYVKRYRVYALRVAFGSIGRASPAAAAYANARALAARGFGVPRPLAAIEYRRAGMVTRSFLLTHEVPASETADLAWRRILAFTDASARRTTRRCFAAALGRLFRELHAAGVYHADLKDVNVLVTGPLSAPRFVLLDLERVRFADAVSGARRLRNLVQIARTLGPQATAADRMRFLVAYLDGAPRGERRGWTERVLRAQRRKDRRHGARRSRRSATVSCTVVCQDEAAQIAYCLESVRWCDEIVVVDGGSRDATMAIAHRYTDTIFANPWPGYRAQKQFALDAADGDWVLNLDADERVSDELAKEIDRVLAAVPPEVDGFTVPRLVSYLGRWWYRGGWYPRPVLRLVRRAHTRWGGTDPHDRPEVPGRVGHLRAEIFHYTYEDVSDHLRTVSHLTTVAAAEVRRGRRVGLGRLLLEPAWRFLRSYVVKQGFREGMPGFFVAATDAFYVFLRWARVWERDRATW